MANICKYNVIVKGKKNACYAFFGSFALEEIAKNLDEIKAKVHSVTPLSQRGKNAKYALMEVLLTFDA